MPTRDEVVRCAREWIGTPWHHQARLKGVGADCAGLVIGLGSELFGIHAVVPAYGHTPHARTLERIASQYLEPIPVASIAPGDVVVMQWHDCDEPSHMGIVTMVEGELGVIHSFVPMRKVVEHRLDEAWRARIASAWRFPDIE